MNEHLVNRVRQLVEKDVILNEDNKLDINEGLDKIGMVRDNVDMLVDQTRNTIIKNSVTLLVDRLMRGDKNGVLEMLNNNRDVLSLFDFTESLNQLLTEYGKYKMIYDEEYPEIKKIKETLVLNEKDLLPLLKEVIKDAQ